MFIEVWLFDSPARSCPVRLTPLGSKASLVMQLTILAHGIIWFFGKIRIFPNWDQVGDPMIKKQGI